ncbi:alginate O-acetyltransferase complex protein AlgJ [Paraburkholderia sp. BL23I1N1]|uniref:alginate O-acetyltransferase AlgX-related protein n=1 Tax=Paraburkholderia sp. BL23I1N1 TaxID=1938802 RepID=UPI000E706FAA|nr:twin-arginine translocation pathway signal [Paraburkholderia sp. BL23I1N1]RKE36791.1 alginate O-acetyltransferase complex protein AlgJ [Paraburkholderia sp. BL23I1N1]
MTDASRSFIQARAQPKPLNRVRRRLLLALAAAPLGSALSLLPRRAFAAASTSVIEGRNLWLYPGWESLTDDATSACLKAVDLIHQATDKLAARGIRSVIVIAPLKARSCPENLPAGTAMSTSVAGRYAAIHAHAGSLGLQIVDGDGAIAAVDPAQEKYIRADYHWSAHSAEAVAARVAERLAAAGPLKGADGGGSRLGKWNEEVRYGDLAALLPPERKKAVGKDHFIVRTVVASPGLVDGGPPVVQVVGNSMVQPYLGFPQKLSNAIDRPVGLTWTFGDTGPWKTLLNYVESADFKANPPQAIVWQFNEGQMMNLPSAGGQWDAASVMADDAFLARLSKAIA